MDNRPQEKLPLDSASELRSSTAYPLFEEKLYRAGTLHYTLRGLAVLFTWLFLGDFAFTFFESIFSRFIPIYLKNLDASNTLIGIMTGSMAGLVNILFLPNISQWSDRFRSRLGRRIPFLFVVAPLTVLSLMLVGFAPEIGAWLHGHVLAHVAPVISETALVLALLCVFIVSFHFFNMVLVNAYNWLLRDVVPLELMGRFVSWFRIVGTAGAFVFLWFVFPRLLEYRWEACIGIGLFYLAAFLPMCWRVKEGEYAPPPPKEARPGMWKAYAVFFRECLSIPLYRDYFLVNVLLVLAFVCADPFITLFGRDTLGLSMDDMGKIFAWKSSAAVVAYFGIGWLCDRLNPMVVLLASFAGFFLTVVLSYLLVHDKMGFLVSQVVVAVPSAGWGIGSLTMMMILFPKEKFAQFSSGLSVFGCGAWMCGNFLIGEFMDWTHSNYRMAYLWSAAFFALAIPPMIVVYRGWIKHGGPLHYVPPLPASAG